MNKKIVTGLALAGSLLVAWNCSDPEGSPIQSYPIVNNNAPGPGWNVANNSWLYTANQNYIISSTDFSVTNNDGVMIGSYNPQTGDIVDIDGNPIASGVYLNELSVLTHCHYLIQTDNVVLDFDRAPVGIYNPEAFTITLVMDSSVVNLNTCEVTLPGSITGSENPAITPASSAAQAPSSSGNAAVQDPDSPVSTVTSSAAQAPKSSASDEPQQGQGGNGSITVTGNLTQSVSKNGKMSQIVFNGVTKEPERTWALYFLDIKLDANAKTYTVNATIPEYLPDGKLSDTFKFEDGSTFTITLNIGNVSAAPKSSASNNNNNQQQAQSSAARSSSSRAVIASSANEPLQSQGCPAIKYVNGGASGSGWATRYWDCCKPSCSWPQNAGGNVAKQCDRSGNTISDGGSTSICNGGNAATCLSQIPFTVSGCTEYAFAFAAVPASNGGKCGHCYELTFTGTGKYSNDANQKKLKGKKLIIMASNVGTDVEQGQFDVMIPGGGVGIFNGCSAFGWGNMGEQYGGLLSKCETENNYSASKYASCLTNKCNDTFKNDAKAKEGCLFLATWMEAAGNPNHTYKEVECPSVLKSKY